MALVALGVLLALAVVAATRPSQQATAVPSPLLGKVAPSFDAPRLGGGRLSLASLRGRYVVLNFFASWCPPCQEEEPALVRFAFDQARRPDGAVLVGVVFDDPDAAARQFVETWGARWPTVTDPGGQVATDYGVTAPPSTFVIAPGGKVVAEESGPVTAAQLERAVGQGGG